MSLTVREAALRTPVAVPPETPIQKAELQLLDLEASDVFVIDMRHRLLGVVPDYELLKHRLIGGNPAAPIRSLMTPVTVSLLPSSSLESAALLLREHLRASIPVVEEGRLIGQLCRTSVLHALVEFSAASPVPPAAPPVPAPRFLRALATRKTVLPPNV